MQQSLRRWLSAMSIAIMVTTLAGCGTLLYPERKGQLSGDIDPAVAVANGIGLLFFIVPGVIAYAVDFSNGTIYLPNSQSASIDALKLDNSIDIATLDRLLSEKAGRPVSVESEQLRIEEVDSLEEALALVRMSGVHDHKRLELL
ncbi:hypothetical protein VRRI112168_12785 [Vreelandella rituensis]|uniref:Uncharacterized protein n=1 Tax=Vreelandella rituensis TaxID=2282306 RepID=A0A368TPE0_9GAMM|nr:hypothetical protein [Halomonas rituensis]RCV86112.1 hypothetical protein DU506_19080 [Halomonas rituensis]